MWGQLANNLGNVVEAAKKQMDELEQQLDAAVAEDTDGLMSDDLPDMDGLLVTHASDATGDIATKQTDEEGVVDGESAANPQSDEKTTLQAHHGWNVLRQISGTMTEEEAEKSETREKEHAEVKKQLEAAHESWSKVKQEHAAELAAVKARAAEQQHAAQLAHEEEKKEVTAQIKASLQKEVDTLRARETSANAQIVQLTQEIKLRDQSLTAAKTESDTLTLTLTTQLESANAALAEATEKATEAAETAEAAHAASMAVMRSESQQREEQVMGQYEGLLQQARDAAAAAAAERSSDGGDGGDKAGSTREGTSAQLALASALDDATSLRSALAQSEAAVRASKAAAEEEQQASKRRIDAMEKAAKASQKAHRKETDAQLAQARQRTTEVEAALAQVEQEKKEMATALARDGASAAEASAKMLAQLEQELSQSQAAAKAQLQQQEKEQQQAHERLAALEAAAAAAAAASCVACDDKDKDALVLREALDAAHAKLDRVSEVVAERERALESLNVQLSEASTAFEQEREQWRRQEQTRDAGGDVVLIKQLRKQLADAEAAVAERDLRLEAFEKEGKVLAKQHSDMLATVRKSKGEMKARDVTIESLTAAKTAQAQQITDLQGRLASAEGTATTAGKSLGAMQVASQASADKLTRLELELAAKQDEVASGRKALDEAWNAAKVAKRELAEARATTDDLQSRLGEYSGQLKETADSQRNVESREVMLKANITQLQESMQRHMTESGQREGRLREELRDMRQRWQDVVAARESLAGELSSSSAPLLAQIAKLQETLRAKAEAWSGIESALSERALRAESTLAVADERRSLAEEARSSAAMQLQAQTIRLEEARADLAALQSHAEGAKAAEAGAMARVTELESRLAAESGHRAALERGTSDLEGANRRVLAELKESEEAHTRLQSVLFETEQERDEWKHQASELQGDASLRRITSDAGAFTPLVKGGTNGNGGNTRHTKTKSRAHTRQTPYSNNNGSMYGENSGNNCDDSDPELSALESRGGGSATALKSLRGPEVLPSGELSYAASMRLEQAVRRREEEIDELASKVRALEASREALLKEVTFLSSRNAQLEEELEMAGQLSETLRQAKHSQNLLLLMVGEKEEEIESLRGDIADVKDLYREQLNAMVEAQVASNGGGGEDGVVLVREASPSPPA